MTTKTLEEFLETYTGGRKVVEIDLADEELNPFIVVKHGRFTMVLNPMAMGDHLDVDAHPFVDGKTVTVGAFGMTNGKRTQFPTTGDTSHGWPSTAMVALLVGEQNDVA